MINNVLASFKGQFKTDKNIGDEVSAGDTIGSIFRMGGWNDQRTRQGGSITAIAADGQQVSKNDSICSVDDGAALPVQAVEERIVAPKKKAKKKAAKKKPVKKVPAKKKPAKKGLAKKKAAKKGPAKKAPKKKTAKKKAAKKNRRKAPAPASRIRTKTLN